MPIRRLLVLAVVALSGCNAIYGEPNQVEWPTPPSNYPTTYLRGRVLDIATNTPVAGALVASTSHGVSAVSDANGFYNLEGVQAWAGQFEVSADGFDVLRTGLALNGGDQVWDFRVRRQAQ